MKYTYPLWIVVWIVDNLLNGEDLIWLLRLADDLDPGVELSAHDHYIIGLGQGVDGVTGTEGTSSSPPLLHYCVFNNSTSILMFKSHLVTCARRCWGPATASLQNVPRVSVFADVVTVSCTD